MGVTHWMAVRSRALDGGQVSSFACSLRETEGLFTYVSAPL